MNLSCQKALLLFGSILKSNVVPPTFSLFFFRCWCGERERGGGLNTICRNNQRLPLNLLLIKINV